MTKINLPIAAFKAKILGAVKANSVVIITAETGAGKSTQVPQYLLEEGYNIVVTQPRRLAARTVAERVTEEVGCEFGGLVGYRTAQDRQDSDETRCLFMTDGLAEVREIMGHGSHNMLILDEVHEWNKNIETLVAWVKKEVTQNSNFKVVLMSATLEAEKLANFFGGTPIITVPGRTFPVVVKNPGRSIIDDIVELARDGRNVLCFMPGLGEINEVIKDLSQIEGLSAEILPLHGQLTKEEQARCFKNYQLPKIIISTNVAQTSVTITDIDAVVDSGLERRIEIVSGVEGLYLRPISLADSKQRKGRAGRVKTGVYIDHCETSYDERLEFPKAEILRVRLDQTVLRLAIAGIDMEELEFFHQPDVAEIHEAKRVLKALGCMDEGGKVTKVGGLVSRMPVSVQYGRMIVEAEKFRVVEDVIKIAAILEQGGITARFINIKGHRVKAKECWMSLTEGERESDIIAQLNVFENAHKLSRNELFEKGVFVKAFYQVKDKIRLLKKSLNRRVRSMNSSGNRDDILKSVMAGMVDHLYQHKYGEYVNGDDESRRINDDSIVGGGDWIVGKPFDLEIKTRRGFMTLRLVSMVTKVDPMILAEVAPQLVKVEAGKNPRYDSEKECVVSTTKTFFNGSLVKEEVVEDRNHPEAPAILDEQAWNGWEKPEIAIPDFSADSSAEIPEIEEVVYATSEVDGNPLKAFGVVEYYSYYNCTNHWDQKWVRDEKIAQKKREEAVAKLADLRKTWAARAEFLPRIEAMNEAREELGLKLVEAGSEKFLLWSSSKDYTEENIILAENELAAAKRLQNLNVRRKNFDLPKVTVDSDGDFYLSGNRRLTQEDMDFVEKHVSELEEEAQKETEEARVIEEGGFTRFKEIWVRRSGSNNGDGWVIQPDGSLREDDIMSKTSSNEGEKSWNVVRADELAVSWSKPAAASNHQFEVAHLPEVLTSAQIATIKKLLEEVENDWDGRSGLASGSSSPHVGEGWKNPETDESLAPGFQTTRQLREVEMRKQSEADRIWAESAGLPDWMVEAASTEEGGFERVRAFVKNVDALNFTDLDEHICLSCGRGRRQDHFCEISGLDDFFCGFDPNDVVYWIWERLEGQVSKPAQKSKRKVVAKSGGDGFNNPFADAFAGLSL